MDDARGLVDAVLAGEDGRLPSLTREELIALGDNPVLRSAEDDAWWAGLDEAAQVAVLFTARRGLVARDLLRVRLPAPTTWRSSIRFASCWRRANTRRG